MNHQPQQARSAVIYFSDLFAFFGGGGPTADAVLNMAGTLDPGAAEASAGLTSGAAGACCASGTCCAVGACSAVGACCAGGACGAAAPDSAVGAAACKGN